MVFHYISGAARGATARERTSPRGDHPIRGAAGLQGSDRETAREERRELLVEGDAVVLVDELVELVAVELALHPAPRLLDRVHHRAPLLRRYDRVLQTVCHEHGDADLLAEPRGREGRERRAIAGELALDGIVEIDRPIAIGMLEQIDEVGHGAVARRGAEDVRRLRGRE